MSEPPPSPTCPCDDAFDCRCRCTGRIITVGDTTYYPRFCCLKIGRQLFGYWGRRGPHYWEFVLQHGGLWIWTDKSHRLYELDVSRTVAPTPGMIQIRREILPLPHLFRGVTIVVHVWRIQRAVRAFLTRRNRERVVAFAMAWHSRLGVDALVGYLDKQLVAMLCDFAIY